MRIAKADLRLFAGSILQGIPDAPDDDSLRVPAGRRLHGVVDLEKQLRVVVVPVPVPGACAGQALLMALDPDRLVARQIIDIIYLRNDRARHVIEIGEGRLQRREGRIFSVDEGRVTAA